MIWTKVSKWTAICLLPVQVAANPAAAADQDLPIVDVGYELHQAFSFNASGDYYTFADIRFASPPLGDLRFAKPQPPATNRSQVQRGGQRYSCPQASPAWSDGVGDVLDRIPDGATFLEGLSAHQSFALNDTQTEDCLFLDVFVPRSILGRAGQGYGAPVMVWIYGGGRLVHYAYITLLYSMLICLHRVYRGF